MVAATASLMDDTMVGVRVATVECKEACMRQGRGMALLVLLGAPTRCSRTIDITKPIVVVLAAQGPKGVKL